MNLLKALIIVSEKAANIARLCRQNEDLFKLLIQKKSAEEQNPRFIDDFKTLADVLIQQVVKHDIGQEFPELKNSIKGEENNVFTNKLGETVVVEIKNNPEDTAELLQIVLNDDERAAKLLAAEVHKTIYFDNIKIQGNPVSCDDFNLNNLGVWIDPIDSTTEYINGSEEIDTSGICTSGLNCVTVLIGAYDVHSGLPVLGVVNQPFFELKNNRWSGCCFWGHSSASSPISKFSHSKRISISSSEKKSIKEILISNGYDIIEASGAGYKILSVITGEANAYILSKDSTFKWDTCGPQAILRGLGGDIVSFKRCTQGFIESVKYNDDVKSNQGGIIAYRDKNELDKIIECLLLN